MARPEELPPPDPSSSGPIVAARRLTRRYGPRRALDSVDLTLQRGEFLALFGPNGAGKTTLLKTLATLVRPSAGTVALFGLDPRVEPDRVRRRLGLIGHSGFVYGGLSARDNLIFYAGLYGVADAAARAEFLLDLVGLLDRADDPARTYSRGMMQRLSIARALVHDPELILLDEPYTGLDQHASRMLRVILEQVRGRGRTVLMVTHNLEEGLELSTRVGVMTRGRLLLDTASRGLSREALERAYQQTVGGPPA